jgi:hypothetical protein
LLQAHIVCTVWRYSVQFFLQPFNVCTVWRWVISFFFSLSAFALYGDIVISFCISLLTFPLYGDERSVFASLVLTPGTNLLGRWVGTRAFVEGITKRLIISFIRNRRHVLLVGVFTKWKITSYAETTSVRLVFSLPVI